jgi:hydroxyacylglutathione hydrolase
MPAVETGAEHEMTFEQGARAGENAEDFLLASVHGADAERCGAKNKINFATATASRIGSAVLTSIATLPLEDEVGDVLEKAIRRSGLTADVIAARAKIPSSRLRDALDYRSDLACDELRRLALVLGLNEVGLCALGSGRYPAPEIGALPFCVCPLRMPHGIGVTNAYLVGECGSTRAVLFDTGAGIAALEAVWPKSVRQLDAVFLTHVEGEHVGGLCDVVERFGAPEAFVPLGAAAPCGKPMGEGEVRQFGVIEVSAFTTPGRADASRTSSR